VDIEKVSTQKPLELGTMMGHQTVNVAFFEMITVLYDAIS
jgi:hypothetical protein